MNPGEDDGDRRLSWDEIPPELRQRIGPCLPEGHHVWACQARRGRHGTHTEYLWLDEASNLVDGFWFD